ncbi:MAG: nitrogen regulation protein NR(II) [Gammaproteobacteria bacterium]|nr:nitrogen regulation protein NR(II) [Gammaproteobacteria bacterium]
MTHTGESCCPNAERVLDNLSTTVLVFDAEFRLIFINQAGEVMLAHSARHTCGRLIHELVVNAETLVEHLAGAFTTQQVISKRGCQLQLPDAPDLRVNCTFTPVVEGGEVTTVQVELRQIDHQLRVEQEELLITQQEATRALVRGLAHEIKNPLGGLRGAAQLLEREITDDALKEYTRIIIGEADRLQGLMNRMLGPNNLPEMRAVNIHEVLERVRELVQAEAGDSLQILQDYDPSLPSLYADPDLLTQAILNIVRNASQALAGRGEILLRTRIRRNTNIGTRKHRLIARIEITDNGPGIEEGLRRKIFYPMVTNRSDGTGLGLSIAQALVSRHHGLIECASQPGETTFTILLPLEEMNAAQ